MSDQQDKHGERKGYRITRVYTKSGDRGHTGLVGGQRVPKDHPRIAAYGAVDELAAALGMCRLEVLDETAGFDARENAHKLAENLKYIQNQLFTLGGDLATRVEDRHPQMPVITQAEVVYLERLCDTFNESLPPLTDFVLAGGSRTAGALHIARTVCRRCERDVQKLASEEEIGEHPMVYLNRLSDALFVLSRWANHHLGIEEFVWHKSLEEPVLS